MILLMKPSNDFPMTSFIGTDAPESSRFAKRPEMTLDGTFRNSKRENDGLCCRPWIRPNNPENIVRGLVYSVIYSVIDGVGCRFGRDVNVFIKRIRNGIQHKTDERTAIHHAGMRILQRLVVKRLVVVNQRFDRHPGKQWIQF